MTVGAKTCTACCEDLPLEDFRVQKLGKYRTSKCKRCESEYHATPERRAARRDAYHKRMSDPEYKKRTQAQWKAQPKRVGYKQKYSPAQTARRLALQNAPEARRKRSDTRHRRVYGISLDERDAALREQGGVCAITGRSDWVIKGPHTDHDHETGEFRMVLHATANHAIALLGDNFDGVAGAMLAMYGVPSEDRPSLIEKLKGWLDVNVTRTYSWRRKSALREAA